MSAEEVRHTYVHIASTSELIFYNTETIIDGAGYICRVWMIKYQTS